MVDTPAFIPIEEKHGEDCTCKPAGEIHLSLVAASRACPGDRNPHRAGSIAAQVDGYLPPIVGAVDITWRANGNGMPLAARDMTVHDADTGENLGNDTTAVAILAEAGEGNAVAELTMLVDSDGNQVHGNVKAVVVDQSGDIRTAVFRYYIREMRTALIDPTIPTRESVNRGEHTVNQYREHRGIAADTLPLHDIGGKPLPPHDPEAMHHNYPVLEPLTAVPQYGPCSCGRQLGGHDSGRESTRA